jgi:hypothetical protein
LKEHGFTAAEKLKIVMVLYQGTTSVVPQTPQN